MAKVDVVTRTADRMPAVPPEVLNTEPVKAEKAEKAVPDRGPKVLASTLAEQELGRQKVAEAAERERVRKAKEAVEAEKAEKK